MFADQRTLSRNVGRVARALLDSDAESRRRVMPGLVRLLQERMAVEGPRTAAPERPGTRPTP